MRWRVALFTLMTLALGSPRAFADAIVAESGYGWQTWTAANNDGLPYWDNVSSGAGEQNIGFFLTGTVGALDYWGANTLGAADSTIYFSRSDPAQGAALVVELAGNAPFNSFGWFETDALGTQAGVAFQHLLFAGPDPAGTTNTFTPTDYYGFYLSNGTETFYTLSGSAGQKFAVFNDGAGGFYIGAEDRPQGDRDFQDMVVHVTPVPEPGSLILLGTGLLGLAVRSRRRNRGRAVPQT